MKVATELCYYKKTPTLAYLVQHCFNHNKKTEMAVGLCETTHMCR